MRSWGDYEEVWVFSPAQKSARVREYGGNGTVLAGLSRQISSTPWALPLIKVAYCTSHELCMVLVLVRRAPRH